MLEISPKSFFNFAARHPDLLIDLSYRGQGIGEAELLDLIRRHARDEDASAHHILAQLSELGFVEISPAATAAYDLTRTFANLMGFLLRRHRLTSVKVIQARILTLRDLAKDLDDSASTANGAHAVRALDEITDTIEQMRQESNNNRDAIVAEAIKAKVNRERQSLLERYEQINRLWTRYIIPLRDMIDQGKALDATLDGLDRSLVGAREIFQRDSSLNYAVDDAKVRLKRLRRRSVVDFNESLAEITPLYEELHRESRLARGAALVLDRYRRQGPGKLKLHRRLGLPVWRMDGQLDDLALLAYLHDIRGYAPPVPQPLPAGLPTAREMRIDQSELADRIKAELPIADALDWVLHTFPEAPLAQALKAYARMKSETYGSVRFAAQARTYKTPTHEITAHPMEVVAPDGSQ